MSLSQKLFFPDKITRILGPKWKNEREFFGRNEKRVRIENRLFLDLPGKYRIFFTFSSPNKPGDSGDISVLTSDASIEIKLIRVFKNFEYEIFTLVFENITKIKYLYRQKIMVFESKQKDFYSQLWISSNGDFRARLNIPISMYEQGSWIDIMGGDKEDEIFEADS
jgi:hypothetical protein